MSDSVGVVWSGVAVSAGSQWCSDNGGLVQKPDAQMCKFKVKLRHHQWLMIYWILQQM